MVHHCLFRFVAWLGRKISANWLKIICSQLGTCTLSIAPSSMYGKNQITCCRVVSGVDHDRVTKAQRRLNIPALSTRKRHALWHALIKTYLDNACILGIYNNTFAFISSGNWKTFEEAPYGFCWLERAVHWNESAARKKIMRTCINHTFNAYSSILVAYKNDVRGSCLQIEISKTQHSDRMNGFDTPTSIKRRLGRKDISHVNLINSSFSAVKDHVSGFSESPELERMQTLYSDNLNRFLNSDLYVSFRRRHTRFWRLFIYGKSF